jgi:cell wall-associated NlpC family hydrolase
MDAADRQAIVDEALSWQGTPYRHRQASKGVGADCGMFPIAVFRSQGFLNDYDVGEYSRQWYMHQAREMYLEHAAALGAKPLAIADLAETQPADFIVFKIGRTYSHGAIVIEWPTVIHAAAPHSVMLADASRDAGLYRRQWKAFTA